MEDFSERLQALNEPFFKATTPDDRISVEVHENGFTFDCTVTLDGKTIIEELHTDDQDKMFHWTKRQMIEAMRRCTKT